MRRRNRRWSWNQNNTGNGRRSYHVDDGGHDSPSVHGYISPLQRQILRVINAVGTEDYVTFETIADVLNDLGIPTTANIIRASSSSLSSEKHGSLVTKKHEYYTHNGFQNKRIIGLNITENGRNMLDQCSIEQCLLRSKGRYIYNRKAPVCGLPTGCAAFHPNTKTEHGEMNGV